MSFAEFRASLGGSRAETHPEQSDESLRGRTYAIPFATVWKATVDLASGSLRGWKVTQADEDAGILRAECSRLLSREADDVEIRISLDENAQTRVDAASTSRRERGDGGRNARRIRRFFKALDKRVGAKTGNVIDPTMPLIRHTLSAVMLLAVGLQASCGPADQTPAETGVVEADSSGTKRNFQPRSYERHIVFLTFQGDSTLMVPWSFTARTLPEGVDREVRGWLARSDTWDPFFWDMRTGPASVAPWRILPQGPVRLVVGLGDALETVVFQEGGRNLELHLGRLLVEWSGQRAQTYRVHEGALVLSERTVVGHVLDFGRAWTDEDAPPGDWGILLSGDSVQVVMEDLAPEPGPEGGSFSLWARVEFLDRRWQGIQLSWSDVRAFEPARRDVPMSWEVRDPSGEIAGSLGTTSPFLEADEGDGPMLPMNALFVVTGNLVLDGRDYPVQGFIRHTQR